ncbi:MAG: T9SS type A sorting domain-containing protein [Ignavibacteria bacterium]|nr:T9SS type A sorting domain-containing protein [Ignavibacteria bacterium]
MKKIIHSSRSGYETPKITFERLIMKKFTLIMFSLCILLTMQVSAQWINKWTSAPISYTTLTGWFNFEKTEDSWKQRFYYLDTLKFMVYADHFSQNPQYTYNFTNAEQLAGQQLYSMAQDVTGDGITEFYVLGWYGNSTDYRQGFKILDITTNTAVFEKNNVGAYYSYPTFADVDGDGVIECYFIKYPYPFDGTYTYEVYTTGTTGLNTNDKPIRFELKQNFPNPFNPSTKIEFSIDRSENVKLEIFDITGSSVITLLNEFKEAGAHSVIWDGKDSQNFSQPTGVYFYRLNISNHAENRKMIILK